MEDLNSLTESIISSMNAIKITEGTGNYEKEIFGVISQCVQLLSENSSYDLRCFQLIDSVIDRLWEKLNTGKWQDVPDIYRDLYAFASCIKTGIILRRIYIYDQSDSVAVLEILTDAIKAADMGLLLGNSMRTELSQVATKLCRLVHLVSDHENESEVRLFPSTGCISEIVLQGEQIPVEICPSIESFLANHFNPRIPVKLKGCIDHWPALKKWPNVNYILEKMGPRTVPVEIGSSYTSLEWSQKLTTVRSFIESYMIAENAEIGYLAQHQLFNQIPELLEDIREPEYCFLSESYEGAGGIDVNAWFGPARTVSSMHFDPKHNLLTQVVGSKVIILVDPKYSENLYPHDDHLLFNTSRVNPEDADFDRFPKFKDVELMRCVLEPGDMLYIPPKWWHHVRSLSISFSVSFWWN